MKRYLFLMLLVACLIALPNMSQAFEGILIHKTTNTPSNMNPGMEAMEKMLGNMPPEQRKMIEQRMKQAMGDGASAPEESTQTTYVKKDKVRIDFDQAEGENMFVIIDMKERVVRNVSPQRNAYFEMNLDEVGEMGKEFTEMSKAHGMNKAKIGTFKKTGEKKRINGYSCELYTQQVGEYTNEYWITKKISMKNVMGDSAGYMKSFGKMTEQGAPQNSPIVQDGYPVLAITKTKYGTNRNELIKLEKKKLANDLFSTPKGYKKQTLQDMMMNRQRQ